MDNIDKNEFVRVVSRIKNEIRMTRVRAMQQVNSNLIMMYYRVGKIMHENIKYGNRFIEETAKGLKLEMPELEGFSARNLRRMKLFYEEYKDDSIWPQLVAKLPWGHNILLIEKIKDKNVRRVYLEAAVENGWSRNVLDLQIKSGYHKRVGASVNNFKALAPAMDSDLVNQIFKDPYVFDFLTLREGYKEKELESKMVERIRDVLLELGNGWSFVGNQYKITVGDEDFFIDLLFYHLKLKCFNTIIKISK